MSRTSKHRLACVAAIALLGVVGVAEAFPVNQTITTYYSDKTLSKEVGLFSMDCTGHQQRTGTTSKFSVKETSACNPSSTPSSGNCACYLDGRLGTCPPHACN